MSRLSLRTFPAAANEEAMRFALSRVNLGYHLNPAAHLAMSAPVSPGNDLQRKLLDLFEVYRPDRSA